MKRRWTTSSRGLEVDHLDEARGALRSLRATVGGVAQLVELIKLRWGGAGGAAVSVTLLKRRGRSR